MKTLGRILIILLATVLVGAALYFLVDANSSGADPSFDRPEGAEFRPQGERPQGDFPEGMRPERGGGERGAVGGRWMFGLVKNVGVIALLVAVIVIPKSLFKKKADPQVEDTNPQI
ncbi:MAG: hypothetical protein HY869_11175 [Chloroflexi bacterium]|nr:hypothetical protein [Chloroflexota bacterium]